MKKFIVQSIILTIFCFNIIDNSSGLTKPAPFHFDKKETGEAFNLTSWFPQKCDSIRTDSVIIIHQKSDGFEIWMFKNGAYKVLYNDGQYIAGTWKFDANTKKIIFNKDISLSTSEKDYQFQLVITEYEYTPLENEPAKGTDPYPLLAK
jgi:hypothetical protein